MENKEAKEPTANYGQPLNFEKVWLMFQETDKKFQETDKIVKENARETKALRELFTSQWGRLMESLVEGDLVKLLNERGIKVSQTLTRVKGNYKGKSYEFDIIALNGNEIVVVEVKTTLRPDDVKKFIEKLGHIKTWMPYYKNMNIYGAVAYLTAHAGSELTAANRGLFVIRAIGSSSTIINTKDFNPRVF